MVAKKFCRISILFLAQSDASEKVGTIVYKILDGYVTEDPHKPEGIPHLCMAEFSAESSSKVENVTTPKSTFPIEKCADSSNNRKRKSWIYRCRVIKKDKR